MKNYLLDTFLSIKKKHQGLTADFISQDTGTAISDIISGKTDFALVFQSIKHPDIELHELHSGQFAVAVKNSHPILKVPINKRPQELSSLSSITFKPNAGAKFSKNHPAFKPLGVKPKHTFFYDNNDSSIKLLRKTDGWALLPDLVIKENKKHITALNLGKSWCAPSSVNLIKRRAVGSNLAFDTFREELISQFN